MEKLKVSLYLYEMIAIGNTLVSDDLLERKFVCDLLRCKGACCVEGESGAPLEEEEKKILRNIYPQVKSFLSEAGKQAIEEQGLYVTDSDGEETTPLINGKECAYTVFENGITACAIEKAWKEKNTGFRKPISCHLYPIRITSHKNYDAVNYHAWEICRPACEKGKAANVPLFVFLKEALVRKYGIHWFKELEHTAANYPSRV